MHHQPGQLTVEVHDLRADHTPCPQTPGEGDISGRGLRLVEALTDAWGAYLTPDGGKAVWVRLATTSPDTRHQTAIIWWTCQPRTQPG